MRKKIGLALGSGGTRGFAHIGVIKALEHHQIPIDYIAGASIGAWIGAHYATFTDITLTESVTAGRKSEKLAAFWEPTLRGGVIRGDKFEFMLETLLEGARFSDTKIPLHINATDLISGEQVIFTEGKLARAAHASMAVPGFFAPVVDGERVLVDGGVSNPVPDDQARSMGADIVIAVNLDFFQNPADFTLKKVSLGLVAGRTEEILRHYLAKDSMRDADFVIQPPLAKYSNWTDYFTTDTTGEIIAIGEAETEKMIPQILAAIESPSV